MFLVIETPGEIFSFDLSDIYRNSSKELTCIYYDTLEPEGSLSRLETDRPGCRRGSGYGPRDKSCIIVKIEWVMCLVNGLES